MENSSPSIQNTEKNNLFFSRGKRRIWTEDETAFFLKCLMPHRHEFQSRKKIHAYKLVLKDMLAQGFKDTSLTQHHLEAKMKSLFKAYKNYKESCSGKPTNCIAPFLNELESIFGADNIRFERTSPQKSNKRIKVENDFDDFGMDSLSQSDSEDPFLDVEKNQKQQSKNKAATSTEATQDAANFSNMAESTTAQLEYYEAKLEYKRRALAMKAKFYGEMKNMFKEKFQREEAMEKEKLHLLGQIAEKLCNS